MRTVSITLVLLSINLISCFAQEVADKTIGSNTSGNNKTSVINKFDTIDINKKYLLIIALPSKGIKTNSSYEGGYFVSYFIPKDTVIFSVYSGKLSKEPFVSGKECNIEDSLLVGNVFFERKGYCLKSSDRYVNKKGFFREKEFMVLSFSAKYEWVDASKIEFYDKVFSDIQIIEK